MHSSLKLLLILMLTFFLIKHADFYENCLDLNITITCNVERNGFHNKVTWNLKLVPPIPAPQFGLALHLNVPPGMFVNPDEVADLERLGKLSAYIDRNVDIEKAKEESSEHNVYVYLPAIQNGEVETTLPFHLRYHLGEFDGGFERVILTKPSLLIYTPEEVANICGDSVVVEAPCLFSSTGGCNWKNISYQALCDDVELLVPIGDLNHFPIVAVFTLLIGCIGCIYLLSMAFTPKYR